MVKRISHNIIGANLCNNARMGTNLDVGCWEVCVHCLYEACDKWGIRRHITGQLDRHSVALAKSVVKQDSCRLQYTDCEEKLTWSCDVTRHVKMTNIHWQYWRVNSLLSIGVLHKENSPAGIRPSDLSHSTNSTSPRHPTPFANWPRSSLPL